MTPFFKLTWTFGGTYDSSLNLANMIDFCVLSITSRDVPIFKLVNNSNACTDIGSILENVSNEYAFIVLFNYIAMPQFCYRYIPCKALLIIPDVTETTNNESAWMEEALDALPRMHSHIFIESITTMPFSEFKTCMENNPNCPIQQQNVGRWDIVCTVNGVQCDLADIELFISKMFSFLSFTYYGVCGMLIWGLESLEILSSASTFVETRLEKLRGGTNHFAYGYVVRQEDGVTTNFSTITKIIPECICTYNRGKLEYICDESVLRKEMYYKEFGMLEEEVQKKHIKCSNTKKFE